MKFLDIKAGYTQKLASPDTGLEAVHVFEQREIDAVNAALAACRPLLVRGEPGIGKSQLARAAAAVLGRAFVTYVVDARTESRDLLWHYDAVARLADAQLLGTLDKPDTSSLAVQNYLHPQALWWAFHWKNAAQQAAKVSQPPPPQFDNGDPHKGCLVLIDEIDKAETDVPNGLLEALGNARFTPQGMANPVMASGAPPLVVITTNEERALPDAFVRRCLVLHLDLPCERDLFTERLRLRGRAHFGDADDDILRRAAELLFDDRETAKHEHWLPLPGQAEYLDLLRAVMALSKTKGKTPATILDQVSCYILRKHPNAPRSGREGQG